MSIRRAARKQSNFTIVDNIVFESGLSFRATGLLTYLLSKPDHWTVSVTQLVRSVADSDKPDGRDAIYAILKELIKAGFVQRTAKRNASGQMAGSDYLVLDRPKPPTPSPSTDDPHTEEPHTDKPLAAEPTQVSTEGLGSTEGVASTETPSCMAEQTKAVFEHWRQTMGKNKGTVLDNKRKSRIEWALKNYGFDVACKAISGCALSEYHMGNNPSGKRYDGIDLIFRNADRLEHFAESADNPAKSNSDNRRPPSRHTGLKNQQDTYQTDDTGYVRDF